MRPTNKRSTSTGTALTWSSWPAAASQRKTPTAAVAFSPRPSRRAWPRARNLWRPCGRPRSSSNTPSNTRSRWAKAMAPSTPCTEPTRSITSGRLRCRHPRCILCPTVAATRRFAGLDPSTWPGSRFDWAFSVLATLLVAAGYYDAWIDRHGARALASGSTAGLNPARRLPALGPWLRHLRRGNPERNLVAGRLRSGDPRPRGDLQALEPHSDRSRRPHRDGSPSSRRRPRRAGRGTHCFDLGDAPSRHDHVLFSMGPSIRRPVGVRSARAPSVLRGGRPGAGRVGLDDAGCDRHRHHTSSSPPDPAASRQHHTDADRNRLPGLHSVLALSVRRRGCRGGRAE